MTGKLNYHALRARAEAVRQSRWRRADAACRAAGLGAISCALHNALVSLDYGKPWARVDYSKARLARRILDSQFDATRWLSRLYDTRGPAAFDWS